MILRRCFLVACTLSLVFGTASHAGCETNPNSLQDRLQDIFASRVFILRGFYRESDLRFNAGGDLIGRSERGFGPVDGGIHVRKLHLESGALIIEGDSPIPFYSPLDGKLVWNEGSRKRRVHVDASAMQDEESALRVLFKVFYKPWERATPGCTPGEIEAFRKLAANLTVSAKRDAGTSRKSNADLPKLCFPTGEVAYSICCGVVAPKELHTPNPTYTALALRSRVRGHVTLVFIVDVQGHPTTLLIASKPLGAGLDLNALSTVRGWKFRPATLDGRPVPVALLVELRFSR